MTWVYVLLTVLGILTAFLSAILGIRIWQHRSWTFPKRVRVSEETRRRVILEDERQLRAKYGHRYDHYLQARRGRTS